MTTEEHAMAQDDDKDNRTAAPESADGDSRDPDKSGSATPTDEAGDPRNADLNAGALSQPVSDDTV
jgi:hypothetical protein